MTNQEKSEQEIIQEPKLLPINGPLYDNDDYEPSETAEYKSVANGTCKVYVEDPGYTVLPEGIYRVLLGVPYLDTGKFNNNLIYKMPMTVIDVMNPQDLIEKKNDYIGCEITPWIQRSHKGNGKFIRLAKKLLDYNFVEGHHFDLSDFERKECYIHVIVDAKKKHINKVQSYYSKEEYEQFQRNCS